MAEIQLAIEGEDAIAATEALLAIPGISGDYRVNTKAPVVTELEVVNLRQILKSQNSERANSPPRPQASCRELRRATLLY